MLKVVYSSPYIPRQWIAAYGMDPVLLHPTVAPSGDDGERREGMCSYARAWLRTALADDSASAIVLAQVCDQMRRTFEIASLHSRVPCFLFSVPATWRTSTARTFYREELQRLGQFLIDVGGRAPSRAALAERLAADRDEREFESKSESPGSIPFALIGPHTNADDAVWLEILRRRGGCVLLDLRAPEAPMFDRRNLTDLPFAELADGCFDAIRDIFQRPNNRFYEKLAAALRDSPVKGLIVRRYLWCDLWRAEVERLRQFSPIPVLDLEIGDHPGKDPHRLSGRIASFLEMAS